MQTVEKGRPTLRTTIASVWWIVLVRGIIGILLGAALFSQPALTLDILAEFMAIYWLTDGALMLIAAGAVRPVAPKWWQWMLGRSVLGILASFVVLGALEANSDLAQFTIFLLAAQSIVVGIIDLITNFGLRQEAPDEWAMALSAILQVVFGILLVLAPAVTLTLIGPLVGILAFLGGIAMVAYSFRMNRHSRNKTIRE